MYLRRIIAFTLPIIAIIMVLYLNNTRIERVANLGESTNNRALIFGDSRMQYGVNHDSLKNGINLALNSESFFYSYVKLKYLIEKKKQIPAFVIIGIGHHSFSKYYDKYIWNKFILKRYFALIEFSDLIDYGFFENLKLFSGAFFDIVKENPFLQIDNTWIVKDSLNPKFNLAVSDGTKARIKEQFLEYDYQLSSFNIHFLKNIVQLLEANTISYQLFFTPESESYFSKIDSTYKMKVKTIIKETTKNPVLVATLTPMPEYLFYRDGDHLNATGAKRLASILDSLILSRQNNATHVPL